MDPIRIRATLQDRDSIFVLDHESDDVVDTVHKTLELAGKQDLLLSKTKPNKVCLAHEPDFHTALLPRAETIATMLTGMPRWMLEEFGGVQFIRRYPAFEVIWEWEEIKENTIQNSDELQNKEDRSE